MADIFKNKDLGTGLHVSSGTSTATDSNLDVSVRYETGIANNNNLLKYLAWQNIKHKFIFEDDQTDVSDRFYSVDIGKPAHHSEVANTPATTAAANAEMRVKSASTLGANDNKLLVLDAMETCINKLIVDDAVA